MECTWKMAFEQRTEVTGLRLRQVPPVIAEEYRKDRYLLRFRVGARNKTEVVTRLFAFWRETFRRLFCSEEGNQATAKLAFGFTRAYNEKIREQRSCGATK